MVNDARHTSPVRALRAVAEIRWLAAPRRDVRRSTLKEPLGALRRPPARGEHGTVRAQRVGPAASVPVGVDFELDLDAAVVRLRLELPVRARGAVAADDDPSVPVLGRGGGRGGEAADHEDGEGCGSEAAGGGVHGMDLLMVVGASSLWRARSGPPSDLGRRTRGRSEVNWSSIAVASIDRIDDQNGATGGAQPSSGVSRRSSSGWLTVPWPSSQSRMPPEMPASLGTIVTSSPRSRVRRCALPPPT